MNNKSRLVPNGHCNGRTYPLLMKPPGPFGLLDSRPRVFRIPTQTCPLDLLANRRLLVAADVENLSFTAKKLDYRVSYATLGRRLRETARAVELHAFFSREPGDTGWADYFREREWTAHVRDIEIVQTCRGHEKLANSDTLLAFHLGRLAAESDADVLVCSGDGSLVCDLARALAELPVRRAACSRSGFPARFPAA
jgi:hypothetical protein